MDEIRHFVANYSIDANRIIIGGGCMGGTGGVRTTALHPDHFSAGYNMTGGMSDGAPTGGMYDARQLKENLAGTSFLDFDSPMESNYSSGGQHALQLWLGTAAATYPGSYDHLEMTDPTGTHVNIKEPYLSTGWDWMRGKTRNLWPDRVIYKTFGLRWDGAYWVHFDTIVDSKTFASVIAEVKRNPTASVVVTLTNCDRFHLDLAQELLPGYASANVVINGGAPVTAPVGGTSYFARTSKSPEVWTLSPDRYPKTPVKKHGVSGPMIDMFMDGPILVVYGTATGRSAEEQNKMVDTVLDSMWPKPGRSGDFVVFRTDFERKADTAVTPDDIANKNLLLVGRPYQNSWVASLSGLPITFGSGEVFSIGGKTFTTTETYAVIFPNPKNVAKYVMFVPENYYGGRVATFKDVMVGKLNNTNYLSTSYQAYFAQNWGIRHHSGLPQCFGVANQSHAM